MIQYYVNMQNNKVILWKLYPDVAISSVQIRFLTSGTLCLWVLKRWFWGKSRCKQSMRGVVHSLRKLFSIIVHYDNFPAYVCGHERNLEIFYILMQWKSEMKNSKFQKETGIYVKLWKLMEQWPWIQPLKDESSHHAILCNAIEQVRHFYEIFWVGKKGQQ